MLRRTPTTPFIEALSAANTGTGAREGGWSVVNVAGDVVTVARDGLRVWARREEIYTDAEDIPSPGQLRAVRFPKELFKLSPGFYLALGNEGLAFEPGRGAGSVLLEPARRGRADAHQARHPTAERQPHTFSPEGRQRSRALRPL